MGDAQSVLSCYHILTVIHDVQALLGMYIYSVFVILEELVLL